MTLLYSVVRTVFISTIVYSQTSKLFGSYVSMGEKLNNKDFYIYNISATLLTIVLIFTTLFCFRWANLCFSIVINFSLKWIINVAWWKFKMATCILLVCLQQYSTWIYTMWDSSFSSNAHVIMEIIISTCYLRSVCMIIFS